MSSLASLVRRGSEWEKFGKMSQDPRRRVSRVSEFGLSRDGERQTGFVNSLCVHHACLLVPWWASSPPAGCGRSTRVDSSPEEGEAALARRSGTTRTAMAVGRAAYM
jgi:hypothetical protein